MSVAAQKDLLDPNMVIGKSSEFLARLIGEAKMGEVQTIAQAREACGAKALEIIRALRTADPFYEEGQNGRG